MGNKKVITKYSDSLRFVSHGLFTLLIALMFYALNYYTPMYCDDYSYSFSFSTGEKITSISQIVGSQIGHYQNTNGRSITHALAQLFLLAGDTIFNYVNVFSFVLLVYLMYFHACGSFKKMSMVKLSMIVMLLFLSCPAFGQSFLWITGAANYLYGILIVLIVLLPYRLQSKAEYSIKYPLVVEILAALIYLGLGVIAGWTNENTSVAMIVMMIAYILLFSLKKMRLHAWNISGCVGGISGCVIMLSSPGTASRLVSAGGSGGIISWLKRMIFYSCDMFVNCQIILLLFCILLILYFCQNGNLIINGARKEKMQNFNGFAVTLIYLLGFLASVYSMIVSPQFPGRAWSGPIILLLITVVGISSLVDMSCMKIRIGKYFALTFVIIVCISTYINAFFELKNINEAFSDRVAMIETAVSAGEKCVEIPEITGGVSGYSCYSAYGDLDANSDRWPNTAIAEYYELDEVICSN